MGQLRIVEGNEPILQNHRIVVTRSSSPHFTLPGMAPAPAASFQKAVLWNSVVRKEGCVIAGIKES